MDIPTITPSIGELMAEQERKLNVRFGHQKWHCDDILDNKGASKCVLEFLKAARAPAIQHKKIPELYAKFKGVPVKVLMASRFGDVGINWNMDSHSYIERVLIPELTDFQSNRPPQ